MERKVGIVHHTGSRDCANNDIIETQNPETTLEGR